MYVLILISKKNTRLLCRSNTALSLVDIDAYQKDLFLDSATLTSIHPPPNSRAVLSIPGGYKAGVGRGGGGVDATGRF